MEFLRKIGWFGKEAKDKKRESQKMALKSRNMGNGRFEVNGVVFYADTHNEALEKYRKANKCY